MTDAILKENYIPVRYMSELGGADYQQIQKQTIDGSFKMLTRGIKEANEQYNSKSAAEILMGEAPQEVFQGLTPISQQEITDQVRAAKYVFGDKDARAVVGNQVLENNPNLKDYMLKAGAVIAGKQTFQEISNGLSAQDKLAVEECIQKLARASYEHQQAQIKTTSVTQGETPSLAELYWLDLQGNPKLRLGKEPESIIADMWKLPTKTEMDISQDNPSIFTKMDEPGVVYIGLPDQSGSYKITNMDKLSLAYAAKRVENGITIMPFLITDRDSGRVTGIKILKTMPEQAEAIGSSLPTHLSFGLKPETSATVIKQSL